MAFKDTIKKMMTSSQNGGISRYTVPPSTTKRRTTTNLKTKNNQNFQKIKLYGSPTTKELKKKHSSKLVGGAERAHGKVETKGLGWKWRWLAERRSHFCVWINQEEQLGSKTDRTTQGSSAGK